MAAGPPLAPRCFSVPVEDGLLHLQLLDVGLQVRPRLLADTQRVSVVAARGTRQALRPCAEQPRNSRSCLCGLGTARRSSAT